MEEAKSEGKDLSDLQSRLTKLAWPPPCHICRTRGEEEGATPGNKPPAGPSLPATITQRGASRTRWRGPGVGDRVPSSATVAAQPDSRNLLARGHLWASGKSLSSSPGTDIQQQQQDRTTTHALWPAPRAAAGLPPCQGGLSSTDEWRGGDHLPRSAPPGRPREHAAFLAAPGFSGPVDREQKKQREPTRLLGNVVPRAPRLSGRIL